MTFVADPETGECGHFIQNCGCKKGLTERGKEKNTAENRILQAPPAISGEEPDAGDTGGSGRHTLGRVFDRDPA